jgi:hypothetical protein
MGSLFTAKKIYEILIKYSTISGCITFTCGIIGNIINLLVFTHLKCFRDNPCVFYLIIESISDFLYQFFSISLTILISLYGNDLSSNSVIWCKFIYFLAESLGLITFSMICFEAADQYFSTNYRLFLRQMCTMKLAWSLSFSIICLWLFHSTLCTFFVTIVPSIGCAISNPIWIEYVTFFFYPVLVGLLPIVIASSFSLLAFRNVRHIIRRQIPLERRRFDQQITAMILFRVGFYVCFTLPYIVYRIYIVNAPINEANLVQYAIGQLAQVIIVSIVSLNYTVKYIFFIFVV